MEGFFYFKIKSPMYVKQTKNTFIRYYDDKGYITNQMTRYDRLYNETGADFLRTLSRKGQDTHIIIKKLIDLYGNSVSTEILKHDYLEFIKDLEDCFFCCHRSHC